MTPKEKALQLIELYMIPVDEFHKYPMCYDTAKDCALICVDEMLSVKSWDTYSEDMIEYYKEVKQEIEML